MLVREYADEDLEQVKVLHRASGFQYDLANIPCSQFFSRRVVADGNSIAMAGFLRLSAEAFLICDSGWKSPAWRMEALRQLHTVCRQDASDKGVAEVNAFLPPEIVKKFGRRLERLGWKKYQGDEWRCYGFEV